MPPPSSPPPLKMCPNGKTSSEKTLPKKRKAAENEPSMTRKPTYYQRKDEIHVLQERIKILQNKLAQHKQHTLLQSLTNAFLTNSINQTTTMIAGAQSVMTAQHLEQVQSHNAVQLHRYVHLPVDPAERQAIMTSLFAVNIPIAMRFMAERTRFLDLCVKHHHTEVFHLPNGDMTVEAMSVTYFDGGHSLRQVYDAFMYFQRHQEMIYAEKLGVLSVRESEDSDDDVTISQTRLRTALSSGLEIESNGVVTSFCASATDTSPAYAIGMVDTVDQDDLYPYRPTECLRKNVVCVVLLQQVPSSDGTRPMIAMARWSHVRLLEPVFPVDDATKATIEHDMLEWCDIIPTVVRERLATMPPLP